MLISGPNGQEIVVLGSGYMPTHVRAAGPKYLGYHYKEFPDRLTSLN